MPLPRLKGDAHHPARPLLHGRPEGLGKVLSRGHERPVAKLERKKDLLAAQVVNADPILVVFGETNRFEDLVR